ncbi:MBL fold metallo-hydrolase [Kroppenstedtia pulmonis]|nr:MBL fold metallo-hydrolase [Kroppenstedtia pulmonis]
MSMWTLIIGIPFAVIILSISLMGWRYVKFRGKVPRPRARGIRRRFHPEELSDDDISLAWIGHSTVYINLYGIKILTDPVFSHRVGVSLFPGITVGLKRYTPPAVSLEEVKGVDLILLSHAHLDHLDMPSLKALADSGTQVITAKNISHLLKKLSFGRIDELSEGETIDWGKGLKVTSIPVKHWGSRFPWNKEYGWTGYELEIRGKRVVFAGDTAYTPSFRKLGEAGAVDVMIMPIGAYSPDEFQKSHCTPEQAWEMTVDSGAKKMVPIHWNTFVLSREPIEEPMERLLKAAGEQADRIVIREQGEIWRLSANTEISLSEPIGERKSVSLYQKKEVSSRVNPSAT